MAGPGFLNPADLVFEALFGYPSFVGSTDPYGPDWEDLTPYVRTGSIERGRQQKGEDFASGKLRHLLDDSDRRFDAEAIGGVYSDEGGNSLCVPDVPFRVTWQGDLGAGPVTFGRALGYTGEWPSRYEQIEDGECDLTAEDAFKVLHGDERSVYLPEERTGERVQRLLTMAGFPRGDMRVIVGSLGRSRVSAVRMRKNSILEQILACVRTEGLDARFFIDRDGRAVWWDRWAIHEGAGLSILIALGNHDGLPAPLLEGFPGYEREERLQYNQVEVSRVSAEVATGFTVETTVGAGIGVDELPVKPLQGFLPRGSVLDFGTAQVVTTTADARKDAEILPIEPLEFIVFEGGTADYSPLTAIAASNADQARHGKKVRPWTTLLTSRTAIEGAAYDMLAAYQRPRAYVPYLDLEAGEDGDIDTAILNAEIGKRVTLDYQPPTGLASFFNLVIEGPRDEYEAGHWGVRWYLSPSPRQKIPFRLTDDPMTTAKLADSRGSGLTTILEW